MIGRTFTAKYPMRNFIDIIESEAEGPYISSHRSGATVYIDMMTVPRDQRRKGVGRAYYDEWEAALPHDVVMIKLMAADTGSGNSAEFWSSMGFDYQYDGESLDYESQNMMWKGVNGHPTPATIDVDDEDEDED
jgi:hypothetical protein